MDGLPKHLNSKQDYEHIRELFSEAEWQPYFQELIDTHEAWLMAEKLATEASGVTDDTHEVREITDLEGTVTERYQYEYKADPNSKLYRLGFTVDEIAAVLAE